MRWRAYRACPPAITACTSFTRNAFLSHGRTARQTSCSRSRSGSMMTVSSTAGRSSGWPSTTIRDREADEREPNCEPAARGGAAHLHPAHRPRETIGNQLSRTPTERTADRNRRAGTALGCCCHASSYVPAKTVEVPSAARSARNTRVLACPSIDAIKSAGSSRFGNKRPSSGVCAAGDRGIPRRPDCGSPRAARRRLRSGAAVRALPDERHRIERFGVRDRRARPRPPDRSPNTRTVCAAPRP